MAVAVGMVQSLTAKFSVLLPHLDERQQRLYLASEARSLGHGGIAAVVRAAGVSRQTVTAGGSQHPDRDAQFRYLNQHGTTIRLAAFPPTALTSLQARVHEHDNRPTRKIKPAS